MKQEFDESTLGDLVNYRLRRAVETLAEADLLASNGRYNAAINRLYYACFYLVCGVLAKNHISARTHDGVQQMFNLHFVVSGKIEKRYSRIYRRLFNDRISGDYDDFVFFDKEMYEAVRPDVDDFIDKVKDL